MEKSHRFVKSIKSGQVLNALQSEQVQKRKDRKCALVQGEHGGFCSSCILDRKSGEKNLWC